MMTTPLELELWDQLQQARQMPEAINLAQMLDAVEATAAQLPEAERLRVAGDALLHIAELCAARAEVLMNQWEEAYRDPVVQQGFFTDLVRQTMTVDLSDLMEPTPSRKPPNRVKSTGTEVGSIVATVDKAVVLALVDQLETEAAVEERKQQVLAIADEEKVSEWIQTIALGLQSAQIDLIAFTQLCQSLKLLPVEVWLGLLLGGFELQQSGDFYSDAVWVKTLPRAELGWSG